LRLSRVAKSSASFAGVKAGMSPLPGGRSVCDPIWHVSSRSGEACCILLYLVSSVSSHLSLGLGFGSRCPGGPRFPLSTSPDRIGRAVVVTRILFATVCDVAGLYSISGWIEMVLGIDCLDQRRVRARS